MKKILFLLIVVIVVVGVMKYSPGGISFAQLSVLPGKLLEQGQQFWKNLPQDTEARKQYLSTELFGAIKNAPHAFASLFSASSSSTQLHASGAYGVATSSQSLLDSIPYSDTVIRGFDAFWDKAGSIAQQAWLYIIHLGFPTPQAGKKSTK